jgi:polar amino acid transport system substrate-binding protein
MCYCRPFYRYTNFGVKVFKLVLIALALCATAGYGSRAASAADAPSISICVEDRFWPPGSFFIDNQAAGIHIALTRRALSKVSFSPEFPQMPWKRCLAAVEEGEIDAILGAAYREERAPYFQYPEGATDVAEHAMGLELVTFVLVSRLADPIADLMKGALPPQPIGVPLGYVSATTFREQGARVVELMNHDGLFDLLNRKRVNSLVLAKPLFEFYDAQPIYAGKYKQNNLPDRTGPLYLAFSQNSPLPRETIEAIWLAIAEARKDEAYMNTALTTARAQASLCLADPKRCE